MDNNNFEPNLNNGYNPNMNNGYDPNMNNGYNPNMNNGYDPNMNNGYNPNMNNGYDPYMNGGNGQGYNMPYTQDMPPMKAKKRRKTGAVVLSIFAAMLLLADLFFISLKTGMFSEDIIKTILTRMTEQMKEEATLDLPGANTDETVEEVVENVSGYISDFLLNGELPKKDAVKKDIDVVYDTVINEYTEAVLDELQKDGGQISVDDFEKYEGFRALKDFLGTDEYNKLVDNIKDNVGSTVVVNSDTRDDLKQEILDETTTYKEEKVEEFVDELYVRFDDFEKELNTGTADVPINEIMSAINSFIETAVIILSVAIGVMILLAFIIDRDLHLSFRGLFPTMLVPGLIILIPSAIVKMFLEIGLASTELSRNKDNFIVVDILSKNVVTPFLVASGIAVVVAILCKIVSVIIDKNTKKEE